MMKKIIAAALSVLLGAFGYTVVDKALEERVATLESGYAELRDAVSEYHSQIVNTSNYIISTTIGTENYTENQPLGVGDYLTESPNSMNKFFLRKWENGTVQYIPPMHYDYEPTPPTNVYNYEEFFLYITDSSVQITSIKEDVSYSYYYDNNYSLISSPKVKTIVPIKFTCKGYTDPCLSGNKVSFYFNIWDYSFYQPIQILSDIINSDGSFEYKAIFHHTKEPAFFDEMFRIYEISGVSVEN